MTGRQLVQSWAPLPGDGLGYCDQVLFTQLSVVRARSTLHAAVAGRPRTPLTYAIRHHRHGRMILVTTTVEGPTP